MKVQVVTDTENVIWERGPEVGIANRAYPNDHTQQGIIAALKDALFQAEGELSVFDDADSVPNIGTPAA